MTDNKGNRSSPDNKRIDTHDSDEVRNWTKALNTTAEKLKQAVAAVGTSADKVRQHLKKQ